MLTRIASVPAGRWAAGIVITVGLALYWNLEGWFGAADQPDSRNSVAKASLQSEAAVMTPMEPRSKTPGGAAKNYAGQATGLDVNDLSDVSGHWVGEINTGSESLVRFGFTLRQHDHQVTGSATFPIGEAHIEDGMISGKQLTFATRHRLPSTGQVLISQFNGSVSGGEITLTMHSEGVDSRLNAKRVSN